MEIFVEQSAPHKNTELLEDTWYPPFILEWASVTSNAFLEDEVCV